MLKRRTVLQGIGATALAAPRIASAQGAKVLKVIPQADVTVLDPIWTTAYVTRNHGFMVFDNLFGLDAAFAPKPQMAEGMTVESDGKLVKIQLRDGLFFHDGSKVLARDAVASIKRWGARDSFGQTLLDVTDELSAPDDRTIQFRLKRPFALLPDALGKSGSNFCPIMPERLANTDPFKQITEMVGSGPFRFLANERVPGHLVAYEKFDKYSPTPVGKPEWTAGPKNVHFDRVEWHIIQDPGTAAAALQNGEIDWWENPTNDLLPVLRKAGIKVEVTDPTGLMACARLNHLQPPFNNPAIRRLLLRALSQEDFTIAVAGDDPALRHTPAGIFTPGTPMASDAGLEVFTSKRDYAALKKELAASGYNGEKCVVLAPTDFPILKALADVGADVMSKMGLNVDYQAMDWGSVIGRRAKKEPLDQGGWSVFHTFWAGADQLNPVGHTFLRGQGAEKGTMGWPTSPQLESLRQAWIDAPDLAAQKRLAVELQKQAMTDVPYAPLGQVLTATAYNKSLTGVLNGFITCWNVQRG